MSPRLGQGNGSEGQRGRAKKVTGKKISLYVAIGLSDAGSLVCVQFKKINTFSSKKLVGFELEELCP